MYESPISITEITNNIAKKQNEQFENDLMYQIKQTCYINIDKDELIKALQYDRDQYEKGYQDCKAAMEKTGKWLINSDGYYPYCSQCKYEQKEKTRYCPNCGVKMRVIYES